MAILWPVRVGYPERRWIVLSYEDRLLQLERLELWCRKATNWQLLKVALPIGLFVGTAAGLAGRLAPHPTPEEEACQIMTDQIKLQFGASLLPENFSACPTTESDQAARLAHDFNRARSAGLIGSGPLDLDTKLFGQPLVTPRDNVYRRGDTKGEGTIHRTHAAPPARHRSYRQVLARFGVARGGALHWEARGKSPGYCSTNQRME